MYNRRTGRKFAEWLIEGQAGNLPLGLLKYWQEICRLVCIIKEMIIILM